jgi:hypothetical protein
MHVCSDQSRGLEWSYVNVSSELCQITRMSNCNSKLPFHTWELREREMNSLVFFFCKTQYVMNNKMTGEKKQ